MCNERARVVMDVLFHLFSPFTPVGVAVHFFAVRVTISKKLMAANQTGNVKQRGQNVNQTNHILNLSSYARLSQKGLVRSSSACANGFVKTCIVCIAYSSTAFTVSRLVLGSLSKCRALLLTLQTSLSTHGWPRGELCAGRRFPPPLPVFHELQQTRVKNGRTLQPWQTSKNRTEWSLLDVHLPNCVTGKPSTRRILWL